MQCPTCRSACVPKQTMKEGPNKGRYFWACGSDCGHRDWIGWVDEPANNNNNKKRKFNSNNKQPQKYSKPKKSQPQPTPEVESEASQVEEPAPSIPVPSSEDVAKVLLARVLDYDRRIEEKIEKLLDINRHLSKIFKIMCKDNVSDEVPEHEAELEEVVSP